MAQEDVVAAAGANGSTTVEKSAVTITSCKPVLIVEAQKVSNAVEFYKPVFGAVESGHSLYPKRKLDQELPHALSSELNLSGSSFIVRDVTTLSGSIAKGSTMALSLETDDVEAAVAKAVSAGAVKVEVTEVEAESGVEEKIMDPFGFTWIFFAPAKKIESAAENKEVK